MKVKGYCNHCGKTRIYNLKGLGLIDDYLKCKFCSKSSNLREVQK